jgi:uncharacterized protein (DUF2141 family)
MQTLKFILFFLLVSAITTAQAPNGKKLHVIAEGLDSAEGSVKIMLFMYEQAFPDDEKYAFMKAVKDLSKHQPEETFNVPPGKYAVAAYHDKNGNGQLDLNFWGNPKEPVAYSLLSPGFRGTPAFSGCAFELTEDYTVVIRFAAESKDVSKQ